MIWKRAKYVMFYVIWFTEIDWIWTDLTQQLGQAADKFCILLKLKELEENMCYQL